MGETRTDGPPPAAINSAPGSAANPRPEAWRESVRLGMLTMAAFIAPPVIATAFVLRSGSRSWLDDAMLLATGLLLPFYRLMRGSLATRALLMLATSCTTSIFLLGRIGLTAGLSVSLATFSVLALIGASRRIGFAIIAITAVAYLGVGFLASRHLLTLTTVDTDPYRFRNWLRMGTTSSLLSLLLMTVIDFVIRHVEANRRAVTEALVRLQVAAAERAAQEQDLRLAYERLGQLHQKLEATKEEERRFLSRELHDEFGQTLTALKLRLQLGARATTPPSEAANASTEPIALVDDLISRVRKISVDLRPPLLDEVGLVSALRVYVEGQAAVSGLSIALEADEPGAGSPTRLPPDFEIACFRVVQESITNALRHASARHLKVRIVRSATRMSLSIADDGHGFDLGTLDEAAANGHLGVVGMRERVRARGGRFELTSNPGAGTTVDVELDLPSASASR
jgi:signal transduction histidine kinase